MANEKHPYTNPGFKRRRDPGSVWAKRESAWNAGREARRAEIYSWLRSEIPDKDHILIGWDAIIEWLNAHGFRGNRRKEKSAVSPWVARRWARLLKMPYTRGRPAVIGTYRASQPMTTAHALLAWALSLYRLGGPSLPTIMLPAERRD